MKTDPRIALTGRVRTAIEHPEKNTMPISCTVYEYQNELHSAMKYVDIVLRGGAGVNVILDKFEAQGKALAPWVLKPWIKNAYSCDQVKKDGCAARLIRVADSMEDDGKLPRGTVSIQDSWGVFYDYLTEGVPTMVDLSLLRPKGTINAVGLEASGAESFATIYAAIAAFVSTGQAKELMNVLGTLNEVLRRGGQYKNGIVTFSMCTTNPNIVKYLNIPLSELTGSAKKGVRVESSIINDKRLFNLVNVRLRDKSLMLEKINPINKYLYSNVCREIVVLHGGTCLLLHVNLGMCSSIQDIIEAFEIGMQKLVDLHFSWKRHSQYASVEDDRQVGLGVIGLANALAMRGIYYADFIKTLKTGDTFPHLTDSPARQLVNGLYKAYRKASVIARDAGLDRAFTMAPTQTCAYNHTSLLGNTTCKNINPPLSRRVQRKSGTMEHMNKWYYHGEVETMQDVLGQWDGVELDPIQSLWESWQTMMNSTGLAHTMSFDTYIQPDAKGNWLRRFLTDSSLQTVYYNMSGSVDSSYLNKGNINYKKPTCDTRTGECASCAE